MLSLDQRLIVRCHISIIAVNSIDIHRSILSSSSLPLASMQFHLGQVNRKNRRTWINLRLRNKEREIGMDYFLSLIEKRLDKYVVIVRIHCIISNYSYLRRINIFCLFSALLSLIRMIDKSRYPIISLTVVVFFSSLSFCFQAVFNSITVLMLFAFLRRNFQIQFIADVDNCRGNVFKLISIIFFFFLVIITVLFTISCFHFLFVSTDRWLDQVLEQTIK